MRVGRQTTIRSPILTDELMKWTETKESQLDADQQAVVESRAPRRLVMAGPGSGKTRTLVAAVVADVADTDPSEAAVVTYTNAAADELRERFQAAECWPVGWCGTVDAMALRQVREHHLKVGLPVDLAVVDEEAEAEEARQFLHDAGWDRLKVDDVLAVPVVDALAPLPVAPSRVQVAAREVRLIMLGQGLLSFSIVRHFYLKLLRTYDKFIRLHPRLYWDEGQDMSSEDWAILDAHPAHHKFVVGDPDQAVFGFRGGCPAEFMVREERGSNPKAGIGVGCSDVPGLWEVHLLERNYRSFPAVCEAANRILVISRFGKVTKSTRPNGGEVSVHKSADEVEERQWALDTIKRNEHRGLGAFAVLCRTNRLAEQFRDRLVAAGVPVVETLPPDRPSDWQEAKAALAVLADPLSDWAVMRWLRIKLGEREAKALRIKAQADGTALAKSAPGNLFNVQKWGTGSVSGTLRDLGVSNASVRLVHEAVMKLEGSASITDLHAQLSRSDKEQERRGAGVDVCTVHAAKGREWQVVLIPGCEEGLFPQARGDTDLQEERRLMFVAITRAKDAALLSWSERRTVGWGSSVAEMRAPSRFIKEAGL